jgi:hypothetical protein
LPVIPRTLSKVGKEFLAVVVPLSAARPHFARPAFKRQGAKTIPASQQEIDKWIAYRHSKVRLILDWKGQEILVDVRKGTLATPDMHGTHVVMDCNEHFVTLLRTRDKRIVTHPLSEVELKMNDGKPNPPGMLMLLLSGY